MLSSLTVTPPSAVNSTVVVTVIGVRPPSSSTPTARIESVIP